MRTTIYTIILIAGIFFLSCNQQQSPQQTSSGTLAQAVTDTAQSSSWKITGCAGKAASSKSPASEKYQDYPDIKATVSPSIRISGDSIYYTREVAHLCCRQVTVSTKKEQQTITITEYWFRPGCKCSCSSTVSAVIRQLPKGEYQVYAIETGTDPVNDKPVNGSDTVLRQKIAVQ